ncbi:MAG: hypothetical protein K6C95_00275, partial [Lachnospiraceae bacterium]|nr:hypothetical protein [Lachnospiraceae bacterium]
MRKLAFILAAALILNSTGIEAAAATKESYCKNESAVERGFLIGPDVEQEDLFFTEPDKDAFSAGSGEEQE